MSGLNRRQKVLALCLTTAPRLISTPAYARDIAPEQLQLAARNLVETKPDLAGAIVADWKPLYAPQSDRIVYWEARFVMGRTGEAKGGAIIHTGGEVVEFTTAGPTNFEQMSRLTGGKPFRMVRFGPAYMAAENDRGERIGGRAASPGS
ncbi:MAG: hypothetical protein ACK5AZ_23225 [Bryobacteraceae bacterium]